MWRTRQSDERPIGLLAGMGALPLLFAQAAFSEKKKLIVFGVEGLTDKRIEEFSEKTHYLPLGKIGLLVELLKQERIRSVVFAGGLPKKKIMYESGFQMDDTAAGLLQGARNKGDDHLLRAFEVFLKLKCGVSVIDSRAFLKKSLAPRGVLTRRKPTESEWQDLKFGRRVAKNIGKMDIGQTVVVKQGVVVAVEALEGTDAAIRRAGTITEEGAVVVKVAKPNQALRFDLPCVGMDTINSMKAVSARVLGIETGKTIMIFKDQLIAAADREGISLVGF